MAAISSTAGPVQGVDGRSQHRALQTVTGTGGRLLAALRDFCEGASWEPGRDWLTRVNDPGERQEPR